MNRYGRVSITCALLLVKSKSLFPLTLPGRAMHKALTPGMEIRVSLDSATPNGGSSPARKHPEVPPLGNSCYNPRCLSLSLFCLSCRNSLTAAERNYLHLPAMPVLPGLLCLTLKASHIPGPRSGGGERTMWQGMEL